MNVTTQPTRSGEGFILRGDGKVAAWVSGSRGSTIGQTCRAELDGDEPTQVMVKE